MFYIQVWPDANWPAELGTVPLGNGDLSANAWVDQRTGDLLLYLSKSDAFDINAMPIKLARLRMSFSPPLVRARVRVRLKG